MALERGEKEKALRDGDRRRGEERVEGGGIELCDIQTRALLRSATQPMLCNCPTTTAAAAYYMLTAVVMMQFDIEIGPSLAPPSVCTVGK